MDWHRIVECGFIGDDGLDRAPSFVRFEGDFQLRVRKLEGAGPASTSTRTWITRSESANTSLRRSSTRMLILSWPTNIWADGISSTERS